MEKAEKSTVPASSCCFCNYESDVKLLVCPECGRNEFVYSSIVQSKENTTREPRPDKQSSISHTVKNCSNCYEENHELNDECWSCGHDKFIRLKEMRETKSLGYAFLKWGMIGIVLLTLLVTAVYLFASKNINSGFFLFSLLGFFYLFLFTITTNGFYMFYFGKEQPSLSKLFVLCLIVYALLHLIVYFPEQWKWEVLAHPHFLRFFAGFALRILES